MNIKDEGYRRRYATCLALKKGLVFFREKVMTEIKVRKGCDTATYGCCVAEFSHVTGFRLSLVAKSDDGGR